MEMKIVKRDDSSFIYRRRQMKPENAQLLELMKKIQINEIIQLGKLSDKECGCIKSVLYTWKSEKRIPKSLAFRKHIDESYSIGHYLDVENRRDGRAA